MAASPTRLFLTQRAKEDIQKIADFSQQRWGTRVASRYLDDLESALDRLLAQPDLALAEPQLHPQLRFYRVNKHLLACDRQAKALIVLTVLHVSMDIPGRLAELLPQFLEELKHLRRQCESGI